MDWGVVCSKTILVVAIVDSYLDRNRSIDETDDSGGNPDEVCVSFVCRTCKPRQAAISDMYYKELCEGLLRCTHPATSVTSPPPTTSTGS